MAKTYIYANPERSVIKQQADDGRLVFIPCDSNNQDFKEVSARAVPIADYVAPPPPREPTLAEKLARIGVTETEIETLARRARP